MSTPSPTPPTVLTTRILDTNEWARLLEIASDDWRDRGEPRKVWVPKAQIRAIEKLGQNGEVRVTLTEYIAGEIFRRRS